MAKRPAIVKTPLMLQLESAECGAVCLGIILAHYKAYYTMDQLRSACLVSRDGSKANDIMQAAKSFGLETKAFKRESIEDLHQWRTPSILFWEFNHFVVLEGCGKGRVFINDPASGRRQVTYEAFNRSFTGIVLEFSPGDSFAPVGKPASVWTLLKTVLQHHQKTMVFLLGAGLLSILPALLLPVLTKLFVDHILIEGQTQWMPGFLTAGILALLSYSLLQYLQKRILLRLEMSLSIQMSADMLWHILNLPMTFFGQRQQGELASRVDLNAKVASLITSQVIQLAVQLFSALFFLVVMATYNVTLTAIIAVIAALNLWMMWETLQTQRQSLAVLGREQGKLAGESLRGLLQIETLKATGREQDFFQKWSGIRANTNNANQTSLGTLFKLQLLPALFMGITQLLVLGIGGIDVMEGNLSIGGLVAFQALSLAFLKPVFDILRSSQVLQQVEADLFRIRDVYEFATDKKPSSHSQAQVGSLENPVQGKVELRDVSFSYSPNSKPVISGVSVTIHPNQRVAFVGKSGSGKSTLAKLICGLYPPTSGQICLEGQSLDTFDPQALASILAMVDQDIMIFEDTIRNNLTLWDPLFSDREITKAAQDACIHEEIVARPLGYNGMLMEGGQNLSGGQAQRLEIARALLTDPKVLLMDEATSALDPLIEKQVMDSVKKRGCTTLIIAHRLSTIRDCDLIVVLDQGRIVEKGAHDELMAAQGAYAALIKADEA